MDDLRIALVTPVLNNFKGYCDLIKSMYGTSVYPIILDNWNHNRGVAPSWNEGTRRAFDLGCTHVLITNDDTMLCKHGAYRLARRLDHSHVINEKVILTSARQQRGNAQYDHTIEGLEEMRVPIGYTGSTEGDSPDFSCFMINQRTINEVGWFDENFRPGYFEDNDFHHRIHLAGFTTTNMADVPHYHVGSQTQNNANSKAPVVTGKAFEANRHYYAQKWGGIPGAETFSTPFNRGQSIKDWSPEDRQGY